MEYVPPCKSTEIGEQCLNACESEQNASKRPPSVGLVPYEVRTGKVWRKCFEDGVVELDKIL